jgi:hypothetical protein
VAQHISPEFKPQYCKKERSEGERPNKKEAEGSPMTGMGCPGKKWRRL